MSWTLDGRSSCAKFQLPSISQIVTPLPLPPTSGQTAIAPMPFCAECRYPCAGSNLRLSLPCVGFVLWVSASGTVPIRAGSGLWRDVRLRTHSLPLQLARELRCVISLFRHDLHVAALNEVGVEVFGLNSGGRPRQQRTG